MSSPKELDQLIQYSKLYYSRMWMFATAGNLSLFDTTQNVIKITASGRDKSNLSSQDFIEVDPQTGSSLHPSSPLRPSAETSIHTALYSLDPSISCILHVHTPASCVLEFGLSSTHPSQWTLLPNIEILKAFGDFTEEPNMSALVIHNYGRVSDIALELKECFKKQTSRVPFFLIENHGITAWGKNVYDANKNLEAAEFILQVMVSRLKK